MIASVNLVFQQQKCVARETSDNSEDHFRYLKMRQTAKNDKSTQKTFHRYLEDQLLISNYSSTTAKLPHSFRIIDDDDEDDDGKFKWPLLEVTSSTKPHIHWKKDHCFFARFGYRKHASCLRF